MHAIMHAAGEIRVHAIMHAVRYMHMCRRLVRPCRCKLMKAGTCQACMHGALLPIVLNVLHGLDSYYKDACRLSACSRNGSLSCTRAPCMHACMHIFPHACLQAERLSFELHQARDELSRRIAAASDSADAMLTNAAGDCHGSRPVTGCMHTLTMTCH